MNTAIARILVVDDDPLLLKSGRLQLEAAGYHVTVAGNASDALAAARRELPDLVLSDVMMPGTDGFQLCRALRRDPATESVPVVLVSGHYGDPLDLRHAAHCGANMFVSRFEGPDGIARGVRMALQNPETRLKSADDLSLVAEHDRQVSARLEQEHLNYRGIFEGIADAVVVTDAEFSIMDANPAFTLMSGRTLEEVCGKPVAELVPPQEHARLAGDFRRYVETGRHEGEFPFLHKDGGVRQGHFSGHRTRANRYVNIIRDVTEQHRKEQLLQLMAYTDPLTGLANRTRFEQQLERAVADAVSGGHAAGVLILSFGNFREINDTLGPLGGDQVLCEVASRLSAVAGGAKAAGARLGASQFAVLLPRLDDAEHLERMAQALTSALATPIIVDGIPVEVTPCIGAAHCPDDALMGGELLRRASVAQHDARTRQISYARYSTELDPFCLSRLTLVSELRQAIAHNHLELWYQPKLDLHSGRVDAVEALVRWRHPLRGLVSPDAFIPTAERTGLIHLVTCWVLNEALQQVRRWQDQGLHLNVAINVSQGDLAEASFQARVLRALEVNRVPASSLTLEITETAAMQNPKRTAEVLGELRQRGVRISLDDFGTGQASLAHLHNLPVNEIKLDKSFVLDLPDAHGQSIARATAMLAREFGLKAVAEGVENAACERLLGKLGFDQVQGFHLSKPLPAAELQAWISHRGMAQAA